MIYFIKNGACVKVGYAKDVQKRIRALSTGIPGLELITTMPGERGHERTLHNILRPYRVAGEWFRDCDELRSVIADALENGVSEWRSPRSYLLTENKWTQRAARLADIICDGKAPESGLLWCIKYRPRELTVSEYYGLINDAEVALNARRLALQNQERFLSEIVREDEALHQRLVDAETSYRAAKAVVGPHIGKDP